MALLKNDGYHGWNAQTGEEEFDSEMSEQLKFTNKELARAINQEGLADKIVGRMLNNRSKDHVSLMDKFPGIKE